MSATDSVETALLQLIFNATTWNDFAENDSTSPNTAFYLSLHTASPGETGSQNTSETSYTGYARLSVNRDSGGWTISGNSATNTSTLTFGNCTASPATITYVGVGKDSSGAGTLYFYAALNTPLVMTTGVSPVFNAGDLAITCD